MKEREMREVKVFTNNMKHCCHVIFVDIRENMMGIGVVKWLDCMIECSYYTFYDVIMLHIIIK